MKTTDKIMEELGAEKEMGVWHYPEFTKGCWGSPHEKLCYLCKIRYPIKMFGLLRRVK